MSKAVDPDVADIRLKAYGLAVSAFAAGAELRDGCTLLDTAKHIAAFAEGRDQ